MSKNKKETSEAITLRRHSRQAAKLGFAFIAIYIVSILIYTAWKLLTRDALTERWAVAAIALGANTILWIFSDKKGFAPLYYRGIIFLLMCMYLAVATFSIYTERGMASNSIILYAIPLVIASLTYSARAIFATAALASITYSAAAISYFRHFPSEGYKVELYGQLVFYSAILFLIAGLLWILMRSKKA